MPTIRLDWNKVSEFVNQIAGDIKPSDWQPDYVIGLSRGGLIPATMLAMTLGISDLAGLNVKKDAAGLRSLSATVRLGNLTGRNVLIVDDGIITGRLLPLASEAVRRAGGNPRTCALVSEGRCAAPDFLCETRGKIPIFPWESKT
jgi:hypoxanthine phosphoribosyltransferase